MNQDSLHWLAKWYAQQCNGDWEHNYGITIETLDNPGWHVVIDTKDTALHTEAISPVTSDLSADDWYSYKLAGNKFEASGDASKLSFLIDAFKQIAEEYS